MDLTPVPAPQHELAPAARTSLTLEEDLRLRLQGASLPPLARRQAEREWQLLARASPHSAQAARARAWMEWMLGLPWETLVPTPAAPGCELEQVTAALERSHAGLREVKERIGEFLAVQRLGGAARGTVLCFSGPPGTGKTSMARAVAQALGRPFVHVPVGGVRDEAELRGRHRAHPNALPGLVLQGLARAERPDPVVLIDEVDKLALGGDSESAGVLLELLDPEQNREFQDHYLGVPFDLSRCIFLSTANDTEALAEALRDRLEVIPFESYSEGEKLAIARHHLLPRALAGAGLHPGQLQVTPGALQGIVHRYTEEAGVRQLARTLDALARKAAVSVVRQGCGLRVGSRDLVALLGPPRAEEDLRVRRPRVGVASGLAWTSAGGSLLPIEALAMKGEGRILLTGSLGEVLRESVQTAHSWVRSRPLELGLDPAALEELDLHLHFPSSATPKDGPSAGVAIVVAIVSLLTRTPARHDVALTGELSLHGAVLPVGGLREKLLAALRAGMRTVIVPQRNAADVLRLPPEVRQAVELHCVEHVQEALRLALKPGGRRSLWLPGGEERRRPRRAAAGRAARGKGKGRSG